MFVPRLPECVVFSVLAYGWALPALGADATSLIETANAAFERGDFADALEMYDQAARAKPGLPQLKYNRACAALALGATEEAARLFRELDQGIAGSTDYLRKRSAVLDSVRARARYNLGVIEFNAGTMAGVSAQDALVRLTNSERCFRDALELEPGDIDAARNVEVVQRAIAALQIEQAQQQQNQSQQQGSGQQDDGTTERHDPEEQSQRPPPEGNDSADRQEDGGSELSSRSGSPEQSTAQHDGSNTPDDSQRPTGDTESASDEPSTPGDDSQSLNSNARQRESGQNSSSPNSATPSESAHQQGTEASDGELGTGSEQNQERAPAARRDSSIQDPFSSEADRNQAISPQELRRRRLIAEILDKERRERESRLRAMLQRYQSRSTERDW